MKDITAIMSYRGRGRSGAYKSAFRGGRGYFARNYNFRQKKEPEIVKDVEKVASDVVTTAKDVVKTAVDTAETVVETVAATKALGGGPKEMEFKRKPNVQGGWIHPVKWKTMSVEEKKKKIASRNSTGFVGPQGIVVNNSVLSSKKMILEDSEDIVEVKSNTDFKAYVLRGLNPGNPRWLKWGSGIAKNYQQCRLLYFKVKFMTQATTYASTSGLGCVWGGWVYDQDKKAPANITEVNKMSLNRLNPTANFEWKIEPGRCNNKRGVYTVSSDPEMHLNNDYNWRSAAQFMFGVEGNTSNDAVLGWLRVEYKWELLSRNDVDTDLWYYEKKHGTGYDPSTNGYPISNSESGYTSGSNVWRNSDSSMMTATIATTGTTNALTSMKLDLDLEQVEIGRKFLVTWNHGCYHHLATNSTSGSASATATAVLSSNCTRAFPITYVDAGPCDVYNVIDTATTIYRHAIIPPISCVVEKKEGDTVATIYYPPPTVVGIATANIYQNSYTENFVKGSLFIKYLDDAELNASNFALLNLKNIMIKSLTERTDQEEKFKELKSKTEEQDKKIERLLSFLANASGDEIQNQVSNATLVSTSDGKMKVKVTCEPDSPVVVELPKETQRVERKEEARKSLFGFKL